MLTVRKRTGLFTLAFALAAAGTPSQDFSLTSLGVECNGVICGQYITKEDAASYEYAQILYIHYAPVRYVLLSAGFGAARMSVDPYAGTQFRGNYGFLPSFGLTLNSPFFLRDIMRVSGGGFALFFNSQDRNDIACRGSVLNPFLGLIFSASGRVDLGVGCRGNLMYGSMVDTRTNVSNDFSNRNVLRGYFSLTLHSPADGAFLTMDADMSPKVSSTWNGGPLEASVGFSVGVVLRAPARHKEKGNEDAYFPAYKEMKEKLKKMAEEIE